MVNTRYAISAALLITACWQNAAVATEPNVSPDLVLNTLVREHPRLMLKEDALRDFKEQAKNDEVLQRFVREVIRQADDRLDDPKLLYNKRGPRLLHVSKACVERIYDLGLAWRWTGEKKYAEKIKENLLAVCDFPDWNPSHFLDTAEMSHAVGIGYDWTYDKLDENVPVLGGENQDVNAIARLTRFESNEAFPFAQVHLTEAYATHAAKVLRGVAMAGNRRAVLVQDEFEIENPCHVLWGMTTDATITLDKPGLAQLSLQGKQLTARVLSPAGAAFTVESAEQTPPQKRNEGVSRLVIRLSETEGQLTVAVLLSPQWEDGVSVKNAALKPLKEW